MSKVSIGKPVKKNLGISLRAMETLSLLKYSVLMMEEHLLLSYALRLQMLQLVSRIQQLHFKEDLCRLLTTK